ncbi:MAG: hypothetical protein AAF745_09225 [Planctomycetota bacterium]
MLRRIFLIVALAFTAASTAPAGIIAHPGDLSSSNAATAATLEFPEEPPEYRPMGAADRMGIAWTGSGLSLQAAVPSEFVVLIRSMLCRWLAEWRASLPTRPFVEIPLKPA